MLIWANRFNIFCFLDNLDYSVQPQLYECLLAAGVKNDLLLKTTQEIDQFIQKNNDWLFGHLSYELKNSILGHPKKSLDPVGFPDLNFFTPEYLLELKGNTVTIRGTDAEKIYTQILNTQTESERKTEKRKQLYQRECACLPTNRRRNKGRAW